MENYYKLVADLQCAYQRLRSLQERQEAIFDRYFPVTVKYKPISSTGGESKDKMLGYLEELEESGIAKDLEEAIKNVNSIQHRVANDSLEFKVMNLKYYENRSYTLQQIADRLHYSIDRVKQVSAEIERKLKDNYYTKNTLQK